METVPGRGQLTFEENGRLVGTVGSMNQWELHRWRGRAEDFHRFVPPPGRALWVVDLTEPALVVGSTQTDDTVDHQRAGELGIDVVRRHSGGGAVWLHPQESVWIDVTIPRHDALWRDDVTTSTDWLGQVFCSALDDTHAASVVTAPHMRTPLSRAVCFGGHAPGEVVVSGRKAVGISQRRTREGARFQCVAYTHWNVDAWVELLADESIRRATSEIDAAEIAVHPDELVKRLHRFLPG